MASLYDICSVVICLLAFAAFLRFEELSNFSKLVRSDVKIENDTLKLFIQSSKTDQYRDGAWIVVASSGKATCPVAIMNRSLERTGLSCDSPLFCQLSKTKYSYNCYKPRSKGLSYSRLRELVLQAFKDVLPGISAIGTHSLRSGWATAAANACVPDRLFKHHGCWASESAKDEYVRDSLSSRLSVSKALGISFSCSYRFLIYYSFYLVGLARGPLFLGVQLAWGFPPRCKGTYGEVFHPAVVPRPPFQLACDLFIWS